MFQQLVMVMKATVLYSILPVRVTSGQELGILASILRVPGYKISSER